MSKPANPTLAALAMAAMLAIPLSASADFTCWTNKDGVRECGDAVPPEYAQKKTETYSEEGTQLSVQQSQAEKEKQKAAEQAKQQAEQKKLEAQKKQEEAEAKAAAEQARQDRVLLATFTSVDDINRALKRKLTALEGSIEVTRLTLGKIKDQLGDYNSRADRFSKRNKPVPKDLQKDIDMLNGQAKDKQDYIASREAEIAALKEEYAAYAKRFTELMQQNKQ